MAKEELERAKEKATMTLVMAALLPASPGSRETLRKGRKCGSAHRFVMPGAPEKFGKGGQESFENFGIKGLAQLLELSLND